MNRQTKIPVDIGRSSAIEFIEEHDQIKRDLVLARDENRDLYRINVDLANENHLLRERLNASEERVVLLQGFSRTIITRFDVIKESVNALETEAREHGIKLMKAQRPETAEELVENEYARQLVARLPANDYRR